MCNIFPKPLSWLRPRFSPHYQSLTIDLSVVNNTSQTGRRVVVFHWPAKVWYPCMAWTNFIDWPKTSQPWLYLTSREAMHQFSTSNNAKSSLEIKGRNSIFLDRWRFKYEQPCIVYVDIGFLLNIFINKTKRSIHFYWIHFLNKILRCQTDVWIHVFMHSLSRVVVPATLQQLWIKNGIYDIVCLKSTLELVIPLLMKCWPKKMALKIHS
jgi:hypothetical protein